MAKEWVIEVLGDLRGFARTNDLPTLAEQLDEAITVALTEIPSALDGNGRKDVHATDGRRTGTFG